VNEQSQINKGVRKSIRKIKKQVIGQLKSMEKQKSNAEESKKQFTAPTWLPRIRRT
jgi:hypothetical protein